MGGIVCTAGDLLAFARMHLESGAGSDDNEVLPPAAVELMTEPHVATPVPGESQALGWSRRPWGDAVCLGQDADTFGQRAFFRVVPSAGFALCVQTNSPLGAGLAHDLIPAVAAELVDLPAAEPCALPRLEGPVPDLDLDRYVGTYGRLHQRVTVGRTGDGLELAAEPSGVLAALGQRRSDNVLRPVDPAEGVFAATDPATGVEHVVAFTGGDDASRYVHVDGRLHRRMV
jgi:hypothetical protein